MTFSSQVDNSAKLVFFKKIFQKRCISNVALFKKIMGQMLYVAQVFQVARVGERIKVDDFVSRVFPNKMPDNVRADEARAARDEEGFIRHCVIKVIKKTVADTKK